MFNLQRIEYIITEYLQNDSYNIRYEKFTACYIKQYGNLENHKHILKNLCLPVTIFNIYDPKIFKVRQV